MIEDYQIPIHKIEPVQFVAGLFGIDYVVVDDKRGALGSLGSPSADLADGAEFAKEIEERGCVDIVGEVLDEEDAVCFGGKFLPGGHDGGWRDGRQWECGLIWEMTCRCV